MRARQFVIITTFSLMRPIAATAQTSGACDDTSAPVQKQHSAGQTTTATTPTSVNTHDAENFGNNAEKASTAFGGRAALVVQARAIRRQGSCVPRALTPGQFAVYRARITIDRTSRYGKWVIQILPWT